MMLFKLETLASADRFIRIAVQGKIDNLMRRVIIDEEFCINNQTSCMITKDEESKSDVICTALLLYDRNEVEKYLESFSLQDEKIKNTICHSIKLYLESSESESKINEILIHFLNKTS